MRLMRTSLLTAGAAAALLLGAAFVAYLPLPFGSWIVLTVLVTVGTGLLVAATAILREGRRHGVSHTRLILLVGILARLILLPAPFELSEDAARYHWDGKVLVHGLNPYECVPDSPELDHLRGDAPDERINPRSRATLTVYPPLAQLAFAGAYLATPGSVLGLKLLWLMAEIAALLLLDRELRRRNLPASRVLILAWWPLLVFGAYLPGHVDILLLPFVILFLSALDRRRAVSAGLWLGLACLVKPFPAILLPAAWVTLGTRRTLAMTGVMALLAAAFYLPFAEAGEKLFSSMLLMGREWTFNGSVGALLEEILPMETAHLASAVLMIAAVCAGARFGGDAVGRCLLAAGAFVVFSPTVFPWYAFWFLPILALRPDRALLSFTLLVPLADLVMVGYANEGVWRESVLARVVLYAVFYGLLLRGALRRDGMFETPGR